MLRAYKYKLDLSATQENFLNRSFGCMRYVFNWGVQLKKEAWEKDKTKVSCYDLCKKLTLLKREPERSFLNEVSAESLQQSLRNIDAAYVGFYHGNGYPKFKSKHGRQSYKNIQAIHIDFEKSRLKVMKSGWLRFRKDRDFEGEIRSITISKNAIGKYFASVLVDDKKELPNSCEVKRETAVGIDLGVKDFAVLSNGEVIKNPRHLRKAEAKLAYYQRQLSRKKKDSGRRRAARKKVAKLHYKVSCQRKDFHHKLSSRITSENQTVICEDLNIKGMSARCKRKKDENGKYVANGQAAKSGLNKSIQSAGWGEFLRQVEYKQKWKGHNFLQVGRFFPSSKKCGHCGAINHNLTLKDREWICPSCGTFHQRDGNASGNILDEGLKQYFLTNSGEAIAGSGAEACGNPHRRSAEAVIV